MTTQRPDKLYVKVPALAVQRSGDRTVVRNGVLGTEHAHSARLESILDAFGQPTTLAAALAAGAFTPDELRPALENGFVLEVDALLSPASPALAHAATLSSILRGERTPSLAFFGAPVDAAASGDAGARHGPAEIREVTELPLLGGGHAARNVGIFEEPTPDEAIVLDLDRRRTLVGPSPDVADLGDLRLMPGEGIASYGARLGLVAGLLLDRGIRPAMLGGDHSVTWFVLNEVLARHPSVGVLHFDAHPDLVPMMAPHMRYVTHASPFTRALEVPSLKHLVQLGLRVFEEADARRLAPDPRLSYRSARELQHLRPAEVVDSLPRDIPWYLSFDIDCIDPAFAPETGTPVAGGLTPYQAADLVEHAARTLDLIGWDVVEVSQRHGRVNHAATVASLLVKELVYARFESRPLTTWRSTR